MAYKDTFVQLITFLKQRKNIAVQNLNLECITKDVVIVSLDWIQEIRNCNNATRNYRLAALRSSFSYLQYENPERMYEWQHILSIKVKRHEKKNIKYLFVDGIKILLEQPDLTTRNGRRNLTIFALMYDSGASEN